MADPISLTALTIGSMAATAAGGGVAAIGQHETGKATEAEYNYKNAVASMDAQNRIRVSERKATIEGMQSRAQAGQVLAAQGASGLDVMGGSAQRVRASQHAMGMITAEDIRRGGQTEAWNQQQTATLDAYAGKFAEYAGDVESTGTVLGTAGTVSNQWLKYKTLTA
jgi:hypothetical protein